MTPRKLDDSSPAGKSAKDETDDRETPSDNLQSKISHTHCASTFHTNLPVLKVVVHPLVLLSVVDHFNRVSKSQSVKRVVGVLLGSMKPDRVLDVANSFAVPFDEDEKNDGEVWFLDIDYLEAMYNMFHKVAAKERIVGWYHTGPKLRQNDIRINEQLKKFTTNPVLVIIEAKPKELGLPTEAYIEIEEIHDDGTPPIKTFEHVPSEIGAEEAEEVGVEHLLRDIKDQTAGSLSQRITNQYNGLRGLGTTLEKIENYLKQLVKGQLPINHAIIYSIQEMLNLLPDVLGEGFVKSQNAESNDQSMCVYMGVLVRAIIALHSLIDNKLSLQKAEKAKENEVKKDDAKTDEDKKSTKDDTNEDKKSTKDDTNEDKKSTKDDKNEDNKSTNDDKDALEKKQDIVKDSSDKK